MLESLGMRAERQEDGSWRVWARWMPEGGFVQAATWFDAYWMAQAAKYIPLKVLREFADGAE